MRPSGRGRPPPATPDSRCTYIGQSSALECGGVTALHTKDALLLLIDGDYASSRFRRPVAAPHPKTAITITMHCATSLVVLLINVHYEIYKKPAPLVHFFFSIFSVISIRCCYYSNVMVTEFVGCTRILVYFNMWDRCFFTFFILHLIIVMSVFNGLICVRHFLNSFQTV